MIMWTGVNVTVALWSHAVELSTVRAHARCHPLPWRHQWYVTGSQILKWIHSTPSSRCTSEWSNHPAVKLLGSTDDRSIQYSLNMTVVVYDDPANTILQPPTRDVKGMYQVYSRQPYLQQQTCSNLLEPCQLNCSHKWINTVRSSTGRMNMGSVKIHTNRPTSVRV